MENSNKCENCKFFIRHYVIYKSDRLRNTNCGHCENGKLSKRVSDSRFLNNRPCGYWEPIESADPVQPEHIKEVLNKMKQRLDEIYLLLNHD